MITATDPKDPDDTDDFALDWAAVLATGETIAGLAVSVAAGDVSVDTTSISGSNTIARISGGTAGIPAQLRYRLTTSSGRQLDETLAIGVWPR